MKYDSSGDAGRNGDGSAPQPVRKNAERKYRQASQQSGFGKDQSHRLTGPGSGH
jgi:hypothetical protein